MEIYVGLVVSIIGLVVMISKLSLLGVTSGIYLLFVGMSLNWILLGRGDITWASSHAVSILMIFSGIICVISAFAAIVRLLYLRNKVTVNEIRELKH